MGGVDRRADRGSRHADPGAGSRHRQAVPDGGRGRVLDQGPRDGGDGSRRARDREGGRRGRDRRLHGHAEDGGDGRGDVPQAAGPGPGGRQRRRVCSAASRRTTSSAARSRQAGLGHAAQEVRGRGLRPEEGRGRPSHAVLHQLPPAVLHADDGRDRHRGSSPKAPRWSCRATTSRWTIELITPVALEEQMRFAIREGGRTVGAGIVTKILE